MDDQDIQLTALFLDDEKAAEAVKGIRQTPWILENVHGPIPSRPIASAMGLKKSFVGWFTLAGGIIGFFVGYLLAVYTATEWNLIVGGKPVVALIPFFIVGFEFTILFSIFGNVLGLIVLMKVPSYNDVNAYHPSCSGEHFGVIVTCKASQEQDARLFFTRMGGTVA
jgi:molybdopterin-containing oxidoreductase family membrane subunit